MTLVVSLPQAVIAFAVRLTKAAFSSTTNERKFMKTLHTLAVGIVSLVTTGVALAQNANMMNGGAWGGDWMGGYGGLWMPIVLVVVLVGLVAWVMRRGGK